MAKNPSRTVDCSSATKVGRLKKAEQFWIAASIIETIADEDDLADAYVTLCIHAGIAAADVICCARLGAHARGESHAEALGLLRQAHKDSEAHLNTLLGMKTLSGYSPRASTPANRKRAGRAVGALLDIAKRQ